jgi:BASS family bile acid:Na+ symporter
MLRMKGDRTPLAAASEFIHHYFIWLLLASYVVAGVFPGPGLWIKNQSLGEISLGGDRLKVSLPVLMLAFLLFNAGAGVRTDRLRGVLRNPLALLVGLAANLLVPVAFIFGVAQTLRFWHNPSEVQDILVGLALVASMPIAGSSTAWSQNANGDLALSLGLVLLSTFLSPWTTPAALHAVGFMAAGEYAQDLHHLATGGTGAFLGVAVILPSVLGIVFRISVGEARMTPIQPALKLLNSINLLALNYSNASVSLPQMVRDPDWDLLAIILVIVLALCSLAFASGWLIARSLRTDIAQRTSLMFGLGMNNNGTGLVLASMALADHPRVLLPIIFYNLVQHLVAGVVDWLVSRPAASNEIEPGITSLSRASLR